MSACCWGVWAWYRCLFSMCRNCRIEEITMFRMKNRNICHHAYLNMVLFLGTQLYECALWRDVSDYCPLFLLLTSRYTTHTRPFNTNSLFLPERAKRHHYFITHTLALAIQLTGNIFLVAYISHASSEPNNDGRTEINREENFLPLWFSWLITGILPVLCWIKSQ